MKIKKIEVKKKNLGSTRPYTIAFKTVADVDCVFVKIDLENGAYGLGAGNPSEEVVGETIDETLSALAEEKLAFLIGRDIREFYGILDDIQEKFPDTPAARAALDIAVHDAFTKYLKIPLAVFLGHKVKSMLTSVTIGIKNVEETLKEAKEYYDRGFRALKVKTGKEVEEDIERMAKLREIYKNGMAIRVDANQGYDTATLTRFFEATKRFNIELIEQPFPAKAIQAMKELPDALKAIIAADESMLSPQDAFLLAAPPKASGIFNIKLMKSGGISPAKKIATIAEASAINLMWGCNDESAISISAALHAALSCSNTTYLDLDGSLDLAVDLVEGGFQLTNGYMSIPNDTPGLGVSLRESYW